MNEEKREPILMTDVWNRIKKDSKAKRFLRLVLIFVVLSYSWSIYSSYSNTKEYEKLKKEEVIRGQLADSLIKNYYDTLDVKLKPSEVFVEGIPRDKYIQDSIDCNCPDLKKKLKLYDSL